MIVEIEHERFAALQKYARGKDTDKPNFGSSTVFINEKEYVITDFKLSKENVYDRFFAQEVVNIGSYENPKATDKTNLFEGTVLKVGKRNLVMTNPIVITKSNSGAQTDLFA